METQYISLNMTPIGVNPCFHISQYDVGRMLGFIVHSGGATVDLDTYTCTIEATRSDGTAITSAVATTDNIGTFEVTPTMSNKADKYRCQLIIVDENSKRIASLPFDMEVTKAAMDENSEAIEEDASLYQQYTEAVQGAIAEANAGIQAEENARIAAVNAEASARASADSNLQSQINQIIAPSGEAPSAAEVENARIGVDGTVYETLGDAIRTQNSDLKSAFDNIGIWDNLFDGKYNHIAFYGNFVSVGAIYEANNVTGAIVPVKPNTKYYIQKSSSDRFRVATTQNVPAVGDNVSRVLVYDSQTVTYQDPFDSSLRYLSVTTQANENYLIIYLSATNENVKLKVTEGYLTPYYESVVNTDIERTDFLIEKNGPVYHGAVGNVGYITDSGAIYQNSVHAPAFDDKNALQTLVDSGETSIILDRNRKYYLSDTVEIDIEKVRLFDGNGATIITNGFYPAFRIVGNLEGSAEPSQGGATAWNQLGTIFRNVRITSSYRERGTGVEISGTFGLLIEGCSFFFLGSGIVAEDYNRNIVIANNFIYCCADYGIELANDANFHQLNFVGNHISYCRKNIFLNDATVYNLQIVGNDIECSPTPNLPYGGEVSIHFYCNTHEVADVEISGNTLEDHRSTSYIIKLENVGTTLGQIAINNNDIGNSDNNGIYMKNCTGVTVIGNTVKNIDDAFVVFDGENQAILISNNTFSSSKGGLFKTISKGDLKNIRISDNQLIGLCDRNPILIDSYTFNYSYITGNSMKVKATTNYDATKAAINVKTNASKYSFIKDNIVYSDVAITGQGVNFTGADSTCTVDGNKFENIS